MHRGCVRGHFLVAEMISGRQSEPLAHPSQGKQKWPSSLLPVAALSARCLTASIRQEVASPDGIIHTLFPK